MGRSSLSPSRCVIPKHKHSTPSCTGTPGKVAGKTSQLDSSCVGQHDGWIRCQIALRCHAAHIVVREWAKGKEGHGGRTAYTQPLLWYIAIMLTECRPLSRHSILLIDFMESVNMAELNYVRAFDTAGRRCANRHAHMRRTHTTSRAAMRSSSHHICGPSISRRLPFAASLPSLPTCCRPSHN